MSNLKMQYIPEHEMYYSTTPDGEVWSHRSKKFLKPFTTHDGYLRIELNLNGVGKKYYIHSLVANTYVPNPTSLPQVNHLDGDKSNNHFTNLERCNASENMRHAYKLGLTKGPQGEICGTSKLKECEVLGIRKKYASKKYTQMRLAIEYNISQWTISDIVLRKTWRHV